MDAIVEPAPAKINLALHVRGRRPDGYHDLETLFAFLRHGDDLRVAPADRPSFAIRGPFAQTLAATPDNLVLRACAAFQAAIAAVPAWAITLDKRLPIASGIGGGSADAAAMLRVLARHAGIALDDPALVACAAGLGADVPACLAGVSAVGTGVGDRLVALEGLSDIPVLLVNPRIAVSTAAVFRAWEGHDGGPLASGTALDIARSGRNDLEPAARRIAPAIDVVLAALTAAPGATLARMSGSGATCFALFEDRAHCTAAAGSIGAAHPDWWLLGSTIA